MPRTISSGAESAIASPSVRAAYLVELMFNNNSVRVTNAGQSILWDNQTWLGVGRLGSIGAIKETADSQLTGISLSLSGIDSSMVALALNEDYKNRPCRVWMAFLTTGYAVIDAPILMFSGSIDRMDIDIGATATVTLTAESRLADWDRPRIRRYTHEDQKSKYPNDKGFEFVSALVEAKFAWGR